MLTAKVLGRELFRDLRQQGGYSYTATAVYESRGDGSATITALADALPDKQDAVLGGFVDVLAKLSAGRIESADLEAVRAKAMDSVVLPEADAARLRSQAADLLAGQPVTDSEQLRAELSKVGGEDVHLVVKEMMGSALLQVPRGRDADWAGYSPAPTHSVGIVQGTQYPARGQGESAVVIGADGASLVSKSGAMTVRFEECVAKLMWPDGARELIGADGIAIRIEPTLFAVDPVALAFVDSRVHPSRVVWMPARRPETIPQPQAAGHAATHARTATSGPVAPRGRFETPKLIVWTIAATVWGLIALAAIGGEAADKTSDWSDWATWFVLVVIVLIEALLVWPIVKILRRRRSARS
jgi:Predicted Zn-dependent peptidases